MDITQITQDQFKELIQRAKRRRIISGSQETRRKEIQQIEDPRPNKYHLALAAKGLPMESEHPAYDDIELLKLCFTKAPMQHPVKDYRWTIKFAIGDKAGTALQIWYFTGLKEWYVIGKNYRAKVRIASEYPTRFEIVEVE